MLKHFDKKFLSNLGLDNHKADLAEFIVRNECLNKFEETDNFYYWFYKEEKVLRDNFGFLNSKIEPFYFEHDGLNYDLNTFEGIASLVIKIKDLNELQKIFNNSIFTFCRREYFLRYSKKYNRLEYFKNLSEIIPGKKKEKCFIKHSKFKYFSINEKNHVLIYNGLNNPRYVSNKNGAFIRPCAPYRFANTNEFNNYEYYLNSINRRLVCIHQKTKVYNDQNFSDTVYAISFVKNKLMFNTNNFDDIICRIIKNKKVPKILSDKFSKIDLIYLYSLIEYEEVDKIIKFLYQNLDVYENHKMEYENYQNNLVLSNKNYIKEIYSLKMENVIKDYLENKFNITKICNVKRKFVSLNEPNFKIGILNDYIRMLLLLNKKINMKINSFKRLEQEHNNLALKISSDNLPDLKVNKKYPNILSQDNFIIEKIDNKRRLVAESEIQKHCVKTYANLINSGMCCIYSFLDKNENLRYTLEIRKKFDAYGNNVFFLEQIKGKFNSHPPLDVLLSVYKILDKHKVLPSPSAAIEKYTYLYDKKLFEKPKIYNNNQHNFDPNVILPF